MKRRETMRILTAWMLLLTFTTMVGVKSLHVHNPHGDIAITQAGDGQTKVSQPCHICNFTIQLSTGIEVQHFVPFTILPFVEKTIVLRAIVVHRAPSSVNAHAPPIVVA